MTLNDDVSVHVCYEKHHPILTWNTWELTVIPNRYIVNQEPILISTTDIPDPSHWVWENSTFVYSEEHTGIQEDCHCYDTLHDDEYVNNTDTFL